MSGQKNVRENVKRSVTNCQCIHINKIWSSRLKKLSGIDQQAAFGGQLMTGILHIYDGLMMRYADKNCVQERLATVTCMKTLLATSQTAKNSALNGK